MSKELNQRRFGLLLCQEQTESSPLGVNRWRCRCDCGKEIIVSENMLLSRVMTSCGCRKERSRNLQGKKFGRLTAFEPIPRRDIDGNIRWLCRCICGETRIVSSNKLLTGQTRSCGCMARESLKNSRTYVNGTCLEIITSQKMNKKNTSGHTGINWGKEKRKWRGFISFAGKQYWLGNFDRIADSVAVRQKAEEIRLRIARDTALREPPSLAFEKEVYALRGKKLTYRRKSEISRWHRDKKSIIYH